MRPISYRPRAILFDHDGVLVASEPFHWAAWERLSKEIGIPFDEALIRGVVGKTSPEILMLLMNRHRPGQEIRPDEIQAGVDRKNELYIEESLRGLLPYPGVREGLEWMRSEGIQAGVVSNARRRELRTVLEKLELASLFGTIISREDAGASKPDPAPYLFGAASLGVDPEDCFAVEDSPPGMEAALMAKIPCAGVLTNFGRQALEAPVPGRPDLKPHWIVENMESFFSTVAALPARQEVET